MPNRSSVFISYARADKRYLDELEHHLRGQGLSNIDFWSDRNIEPGRRWREEIARELKVAKIAILLVSEAFQSSSFIAENELPPLLERADNDGAVILPVYLENVRFPDDSPLLAFQSINRPDDPLGAMTADERREVWLDLIERAASVSGDTNDPDDERPITAPVLLHDPLAEQSTLIDSIVGYFDTSAVPSSEQLRRAVAAVAHSLAADTAIVINDPARDKCQVLHGEESLGGDVIDETIQAACRMIRLSLARSSEIKWARRGVHCSFRSRSERSDRTLLVVPIANGLVHYLAFSWPEGTEQRLVTSTGTIVQAVYRAASRIINLSAERLESEILDLVKREFGHLPDDLYDRRRQLFSARMRELTIHFEPIAFLADKNPYVHGWEALARDRDSWAAPLDVFGAAELWGYRFLSELDEHMLLLATDTYATQNRAARRDHMGQWEPLSVNVYPSSLYRQTYFNTVRDIVEYQGTLPGPKLVLEISEKHELPSSPGDIALDGEWSAFKRAVGRYVDEFHIEFAIDDFGTGYASPRRLAELNPQYVKLDREVVNRPDVVHEIEYVAGRLRQAMRAPRIVAEGVDDKGFPAQPR